MLTNINEVKATRAKHIEAAEALVNAATSTGKDLAGENLKKFNDHIAEAKKLNAVISQHHEMATVGNEARSTTEEVVVVTPFGITGPAPVSSRPGAGGLSAHLRAARAGSPEVREQAEAFEAFLRGDIRAAANLTPAGDGAVLIPSFVFPALERNYTDFSPVESVARVWGTETGADVVYPVLSDTESAVQLDAAAATGADDTVSGDTPPTALTGPTLHAYKISSKPVFIPRETAGEPFADGTRSRHVEGSSLRRCDGRRGGCGTAV